VLHARPEGTHSYCRQYQPGRRRPGCAHRRQVAQPPRSRPHDIPYREKVDPVMKLPPPSSFKVRLVMAAVDFHNPP
jgi:hypothetical protein